VVINKLTKKRGDVLYVMLAPVTSTPTLLSPGESIHRAAVSHGGLLASLFYRWHRSMERWGGGTEMDPIFSCLTAGLSFSHCSLV